MANNMNMISEVLLDDCLSEAQQCCSNQSTVDILEYREHEGPIWVHCTDLGAYLRAVQGGNKGDIPSTGSHTNLSRGGRAEHCQLRIFFISATIGDNELHTHVNPNILRVLNQKGNLSARFIVDLYQAEDWTVFPSSLSFSKHTGLPNRLNLQYGFWNWDNHATHSFVQLVVEPNTQTYYLVNFSRDLKDSIERSLKFYSGSTAGSLFVDTVILNHLLGSYRGGLVTQRTILRRIEQREDGSAVQSQVKELHGLCTRWHTMLKDFTDLKEHMGQLKTFAKRINTMSSNHEAINHGELQIIDDSLAYLENCCNFWVSWARTYLERTNICINLAHHLESQEIALQARSEGISMFTLAIVTVVFLPGTFVASILSTTFFNFDGVAFTVSSLWWILPVITIPLTLIVLLLWYMWSRARLNKKRSQLGERLPERRLPRSYQPQPLRAIVH
ncbi:hypothetical protein F5Y19DRAFT_443705 [Xylariaceae sp. FL1651]|nr:hypothetical protein F5Y19DRAFT_443705 [Xylariaceae sp. FL1651]